MEIQLLLFQLQQSYQYFMDKENVYQKLRQQIIRWHKETNSRGENIVSLSVIGKVLIIFSICILIPGTIALLVGNLVSSSNLSGEIWGKKGYKFMLPVLLVAVGILAFFILFKRITEKEHQIKIQEAQKAVMDTATELFAYYEGFFKEYGYPCPMHSFQFCDPCDLQRIYSCIASGQANDIPQAKEMLRGQLFNYSCLQFYNRPKVSHESNSSEADNGESYEGRKHCNNHHTLQGKYFKGVTSEEELRKLHKKLSKIYHTDEGGVSEIMKEVNAEYSQLIKKFKKS